ncbi:Lrp/AsnC family transcriptional regulator [Microbacterium mitrae]|uniref:Lrp/AsnC family transcriptional regulator n=1 Tax=Microbacterium mitrae TaxID=664640 RepID=A0A5C8HMD8_9MICO|nr:Lrp/AsnC family transcriptional regulator [Microbacterium mitrae]TXK03402.1 Lrp/AsnC family transcriptional regulator [Microbacterium mitrae]
MDALDHAILDVLRADARTSVNVIAQQVHISRANAYARIKRMTDDGVILGYRVVTDPVSAGFRSSAYVSMSVDQRRWQEIRAALDALPEIEHVALVGGDFDVMVLVRARDNRDLRRVVLEEIQSIDGVTSTQTFLIFEDHQPKATS